MTGIGVHFQTTLVKTNTKGTGMNWLRNIKHFIKNIWTFRYFLYSYRWYDHTHLELAVQETLKDMSVKYRKYGCHVGADKQADEMEMFYNMIKKIREDDQDIAYFNFIDDPNGFLGMRVEKKSHIPFAYNYLAKKSGYKEIEDRKIFFRMLARKICNWWD